MPADAYICKLSPASNAADCNSSICIPEDAHATFRARTDPISPYGKAVKPTSRRVAMTRVAAAVVGQFV